MQRFILQSANMATQNDGQQEAVVVLQCGDRQLTGRSLQTADEDDLNAIAQATLDALQQFLTRPLELQLKKAAKMEHDSLTNYLIVVTMDYIKDGERCSLTGTCLSNEADLRHSVAKATLDATNRYISFLLAASDGPAQESPA